MTKLRADMTPEQVEHARIYQRNWSAKLTEEDKENKRQYYRQRQQTYRANNYPIDPVVYCMRIGLSTIKVGAACRPASRKKDIFTSADLVYAQVYFLAKFETRQLAHQAEIGAHVFLEFRLGIPRLRVPSGNPSEQFNFKDHPEWLNHLKDFLADQPGFKHFEIYDP